MFIVVEGNIGAGKTSLVQLLCRRFGATAMLEEFAENTFLPKFYENPEKFAFPLELSFLAARYKQMTKCFDDYRDRLIIADYHFHKCKLFASVNLSGAEFELFESFFTVMSEKLPSPDRFVYLDSDTIRLSKNISMRGRSYEDGISSKYLNQLSTAYTEFLSNHKQLNILIINTSELDFFSSTEDFDEICSLISVHKGL